MARFKVLSTMLWRKKRVFEKITDLESLAQTEPKEDFTDFLEFTKPDKPRKLSANVYLTMHTEVYNAIQNWILDKHLGLSMRAAIRFLVNNGWSYYHDDVLLMQAQLALDYLNGSYHNVHLADEDCPYLRVFCFNRVDKSLNYSKIQMYECLLISMLQLDVGLEELALDELYA